MISTQLVMKNVSGSASIQNRIYSHLKSLAAYSKRIDHSHIVIDSTKQKTLKNILFSVHIDIFLAGRKFVVSRVQNKDLYLAIREAFTALERQLKNYLSKNHRLNRSLQHSLKHHALEL